MMQRLPWSHDQIVEWVIPICSFNGHCRKWFDMYHTWQLSLWIASEKDGKHVSLHVCPVLDTNVGYALSSDVVRDNDLHLLRVFESYQSWSVIFKADFLFNSLYA